ncbi:hypothetical protein [Actinoplanes sp. L3-i22]|uniref:hypothetical protein n=1 Tax=Actinoplanes sp. L3-i22 TaxID=2836373 RepID=UPI001C769D03|nr:hypothetical protein [Actinoplanes sp. L3-i22]BCY13417.1 hypothetical protein L3i22_085050 [Actinoplanes sp. L3-i22]
MLLPIALVLSVTVLFAMVWQSAGDESDFASLERDGVRYIQALGPLEIALAGAESAAVGGDQPKTDQVARAVEAVAAVDGQLRDRLGTQDRWDGLRTKIQALPASGSATTVIADYSTVHDLLLALMDKVRNNSKLIRDPDADLYYLEDGAAQELPEGVAAAAHYTNLLLSNGGLVDITSAGSDLASNAQDLSDDVRLAVEAGGGASGGLGGALLSKLDRFNRATDTLQPLMAPVVSGKGKVDAEQVAKARDEAQTAAADLSAALLGQIDLGLQDRISSLDDRRLLAAAAFVVTILLAFAPLGATLVARRRRPAPAGERVAEPEYAPRELQRVSR